MGAASTDLAPGADSPDLATWYEARRRDPVGHRVQIALAALYLFLLPLATAPKDWAFGFLIFYAILRLPKTWRGYGTVLRAPVLWAFVAFTAWYALSIAWSSNRPQGADEIGAARVLLTPLMLWLVLDNVAILVGAALLGVLAHNLIQLMQGLHLFGLQPDMENRLDGIVQAIQLGAWCVAAMCWHLCAALHGRGWLRWGSLLALAVAGAGMVATGSRGPWISAAIALPLGLVVIAVRRPNTRRFALVLLALGVVGGGAAWPLARRMVVPRIERAIDEVARARAEGDYSTSAGLRVGLWSWAIEIYRDAPVLGAGAGSYQAELWELDGYARITNAHEGDEFMLDWLTRDHAHSTYLHTLAGQGTVGGALLLLLLGLAFVRCALDPPDHVYADGNLFVLIAWIVGAQFDCYHLNGHHYGMLAMVVAITIAPRPRLGVSRPDTSRMAQRWDRFARRDSYRAIVTRKDPWDSEAFLASGRDLAVYTLELAGDSLARRRMLEIGCGVGRTARHFAASFEHVDGIDISKEMIDQGRALDHPPNVALHLGNGRDLSEFESGAFDLVYSGLVFQHIPSEAVIGSYLAEIARVLDPAGRAVIQFDTRRDRLALRLYRALPDPLLPRAHRRFLRRYRRDAAGLRDLIGRAGLAIVEERHAGSAQHFFLLATAPGSAP